MTYYTVEDNFGNITPNTSQLSDELNTYITNNPGSITPTFQGISTYINTTDVSLPPFIDPGKNIVLFHFDGNLSSPEKTVLDGIISVHIPDFTPTNFAYSKEIIFRRDNISNTTYRRVTKPFLFPGITSARAKFLGYMSSNATSYDVRILDKTNNTILSETNLTNTECTLQDLGILSNGSSDPWIIEIFVRRNGGPSKTKIYMESINIEYNTF